MKKIFRDFTTHARSQSSYVSCFNISRVHHQSRRPRASIETTPRRSPNSPLNARPLALSSVSSLRCLNRGEARTNKEGMRARWGKNLPLSRESCSLSLKFYLYAPRPQVKHRLRRPARLGPEANPKVRYRPSRPHFRSLTPMASLPVRIAL